MQPTYMSRLSGLVILILFLTLIPLLSSCGKKPAEETILPPVAKIIPERLEAHGDVRVDNYYWLKERENPEVASYLEAENDYTAKMLQHTDENQALLFEEMKGRIKKDDTSVPYLKNGYYYYTRYEEGNEYAFYCRRQGTMEAPEEIMLNANIEAEGEDYYSIWSWDVSPNKNIFTYAVDTGGRKFFTIHFKDLTTGEMLPDLISDVTNNFVWAMDDETVFYTRQDPETLRMYEIYRHKIGTAVADDILVYKEAEDTFDCYVEMSKSKEYIYIICYQTVSSEVFYLDATNPTGEFTMIQGRERDLEYFVSHMGDHFYFHTNLNAQNFRLMKAPVTDPGKENWEEVIPHRHNVLLEGVEMFGNYLVAEERVNGLCNLRIIPWDGSAEHNLDFGEPAYQACTIDNYEFDTSLLRYRYASMTTPRTTYDYDMGSHEKTLVKQDEILGGFDSANYVTERQFASGRDGTAIPISIVYHKDFEKDGRAPLLLYAYGAYGSSEDAYFSSSRLSLLDRGFVYAIAHVRGGAEMGRQWYEDGKLLKKKNTFTDFIDCSEFLIDQGYTNNDRLFAEGGSAGGLLMGVIANLRPDLYHGIIADVPWVDAVTTMLDSSIPLTTSEYDEWGNPNEKVYYDYILSYSPYDNLEAKDYPNLLVLAGFHDSQVQYWEPAKWVAKMRTLKSDGNVLLLKTNMTTGHYGASGRFEYYRERALSFAFMLDLVPKRKSIEFKFSTN